MVWKQLAGASPLRPDIISDGLNILIVRELTGGIYFGPRGTEVIGEASGLSKVLDHLSGEKTLPPGRFAYDVEQYSEMEIRRIATLAFEMALKRDKRVTSVDKSNVLDSSRLWRAVMEEVHVKYPGVQLDHMYVDNAAQQLIKNPQHFDVLVTSNMFGDILSDEASQITGSIGMLPSASLGESSFGLYEPIHGSAPKYAGEDRANPIATILSAAMMLRFTLSLSEEADVIEQAVASFLDNGYRTPDIFFEGAKAAGTKETGQLIASYISGE
jgi:3-isopropylmalate dehydrogenase